MRLCGAGLQPPGVRLSCGTIAQRHTIWLSCKICRLVTEGILQSQRGVKGGVRLARPAGEINLLQVVEAIDGPITFNRCNRKPSECARSPALFIYLGELCEFRARLALQFRGYCRVPQFNLDHTTDSTR
jgi:DNA-binding IscR family transcriptional regulator